MNRFIPATAMNISIKYANELNVTETMTHPIDTEFFTETITIKQTKQ